MFSLGIFTVGFCVCSLWILPPVLGYEVNITLFEECQDVGETEITLLSVSYDYINGICSTVHGEYEIFVKRMNMDYELWLYVNNCPTGSTGPCRDNEVKFVEEMKCDRFHDDDSGPWYMLSQAVEHERCGEVQGKFKLTEATLKPDYISRFVTIDPNMSRYRIKLLFHKKGAPELSEMKHVRGCINMEFELIF